MKLRILSTARLSFPLATALAALLSAQSANALDGTWTRTTAGPFNWDDVANWSSGAGPIADGVGSTANFTSNLTASQTVNLSVAQTIGNINFDDQPGSNDLTISGANALTLDVTTGSPSIFVNGGGRILTISAKVSGTDGLTKTGGGTLRLSGANDYSGVTIISNGSLNAASLGALGNTTGITVGGVSTAILTSSLTGLTIPISAPITTANTGVNSNFAFGATAASTFTINSAIGGSGNVIFTTPGTSNNATQTVNLGVAGTYTGNTNISSSADTNTSRVVNTSGAADVLPSTTVLSFGNVDGLGSGRNTTFDMNGQAQTLAGLNFTASLGVRRNINVNNTSVTPATLTINNTADYSFGGATLGTTLPTPGSPITTNARITGAINLTKTGAGTFSLGGTLSGGASVNAHSYTGATNINGGTLRLFSGGAITASPSITIDGSTAKLLQENTVTPIAPVVTLTQGTLTGSGTVNTVNVGNATGGIVSNNNGVPGAALTVGTLTFNGAATINTYSATTSAAIVTTSLATNVAGTVTINPTVPLSAAGTYDLISYTSIGGAGIGQFVLGTISGPTQRQTTALGNSATAITLTVGADNPPYWSGEGDGNWNTSSINNWKFQSNNAATGYLNQDNVLFNDLATPLGPVTVNINAANVSPSTTTFDGIKDYVLNTSGLGSPFGITTGNLTKNGSGIVTLSTANTYTGATAINGGTLSLGGGGTVGSLSPASAITVASGATFAVNQSDTVSQGTDFGVISGAGGFAQNGSGTTVLNLPNTFMGPITITSGTLQIVTGGRLNGGAYAGGIAISLGSTFDYSATANQTLSGNISGAGSLVKQSGSGGLTLSGINAYEGGTTVNGTLSLANVAAIPSTTTISMADGSVLRPTIDGVIINAPITLGGIGTTAQINGPFTNSAGGTVETLTLNQPITGDGNLRLFGSSQSFNTNGTIVLNAQSNYTGSTELDTAGETVHLAGVNLFVKLGIANALPTTTLLTLDGDVGRGSGRTVSFDLNGFNQTLAGLASNTTLTARNQRVTNTGSLATLTINSSTDSQYGGTGPETTFSGSPVIPTAKITGNLALTKTGTAKFTLLGVHEYTGDTTVSQGILSHEAPNTLNETSTVTIAGGAFLDLNFDESGGAVTDTVDKLFIDGVQQPAGVYKATDNVTDTGTPTARITGPGTLTVTTGSALTGYAAWAAINAGGQGSQLDFDNDGVRNGVEFFMNAAAGFTANPQLNASNTITWPNGGNIASSQYEMQFVVQTSSNLSTWTDVLIGDPNLVNTSGSLTYTLTGGSPRFVRLSVTPAP
jgi:autotransporter-associated beta strand protein